MEKGARKREMQRSGRCKRLARAIRNPSPFPDCRLLGKTRSGEIRVLGATRRWLRPCLLSSRCSTVSRRSIRTTDGRTHALIASLTYIHMQFSWTRSTAVLRDSGYLPSRIRSGSAIHVCMQIRGCIWCYVARNSCSSLSATSRHIAFSRSRVTHSLDDSLCGWEDPNALIRDNRVDTLAHGDGAWG